MAARLARRAVGAPEFGDGRYDGTPFSEPSRCGANDAGSGAAASAAGTKNSEPVTARL
jgi:hypothetical protein